MDKAKIKSILRWAGGGLLALISLSMLLAFFSSIPAKDMFGHRPNALNAAEVILWWLVILGAGAPAALLLRKAILGVLPKKGEPDEYDEENNTEIEDIEDTQDSEDYSTDEE